MSLEMEMAGIIIGKLEKDKEKLLAIVEMQKKALQELVSQHMRENDGKDEVYGHLVQLGREALAGTERMMKEMGGVIYS